MKYPSLLIAGAMSICLSLFTLPAHGQDIIGHRGLFHNTTASMNVPENSLDSVVNAYNAGMFGVELDLRTSSDGIVMVTHDQISNRTTKDDNDGGYLNPVNVALNLQPAVSPIRISDYTAAFWETTSLKAYGTSSSLTTSSDAMLSLESLLQQAKAKGVFNRNFLIILDIQAPDIFSKAAKIVSSLGVQQNVYLKFFAKSALYNNQTYNGADTCNRYMLQNNLADSKLRLIAQINDGELDINEDDNAGIAIWGTTMTIPEYLNCWSNASYQHSNLAYMAMVSASVPADNMNATQAAVAALNWARSNNRYTMSIVPNPDACKANGANNPTFQFQSNAVPAAVFNYQARNAKTQFVGSQNPNYVIYDVFGSGYAFTTNFNRYIAALCYGTPIN